MPTPLDLAMVRIRVMTLSDYDDIAHLMKTTPGISFRDADSRGATARYLSRNPNLSFVAEVEGRIVGCIMSGHDGRRGYLQHLVVLPNHRGRGIASALVDRCIDELTRLGIHKTHVDVLQSNEVGQSYWKGQGWKLRDDLVRYSLIHGSSSNA